MCQFVTGGTNVELSESPMVLESNGMADIEATVRVSVAETGVIAGHWRRTDALRGGGMDILVMLEENPDHSPVLAYVNSVPSRLDSDRPSRDVVTLYGLPSPESLALALAAAVESHRLEGGGADAIRHLGIWPERGAVGDAAWRDGSGRLVSRDLEIPLDVLSDTAHRILSEGGHLVRRLVAGLSMPDWPEGARRAISFTLTPFVELSQATRVRLEGMLENLREADGLTFDYEAE